MSLLFYKEPKIKNKGNRVTATVTLETDSSLRGQMQSAVLWISIRDQLRLGLYIHWASLSEACHEIFGPPR